MLNNQRKAWRARERDKEDGRISDPQEAGSDGGALSNNITGPESRATDGTNPRSGQSRSTIKLSGMTNSP